MRMFLVVVLSVTTVLAGPNDSVEQLKAAVSNVPYADQVTRGEVTTLKGSVPTWLSGSLARHACGAFGETGTPSEPMLRRVTHLFDCMEMGQAYSFHEGDVKFTSRFYDTNMVNIWLDYEENMNQSSIWWGTIYAERNRSAMDLEGDNMHASGRPSVVSAVSWWQLGQEVLAMSEGPGGQVVDIHSMEYQDNYHYDDDFGAGWHTESGPAHEAIGPDGSLYSTATLYRYVDNDTIMESKRVVYKVNATSRSREILGEFQYANANLSLCTGPGVRYPEPEARMRHMHSMQMSENFIILPENNYLRDPCAWIFYDDTLGDYDQTHSYEDKIDGRVLIFSIDGSFVASVTVPHLFITHVLGSYEDEETNQLHFDVLKYRDASPYNYWTIIDVMLTGDPHPDNWTTVERYSVNMTSWEITEIKNLIQVEAHGSFDFSNINPAYLRKPYKYAYMTQNPFHLHGAVVKLNVDDGTLLIKELPDGHFPTEPIFVANPEGTEEDDGIILMSGVDGAQEKGFIMIYDARTMEEIYHGTAPEKTLIGLHSKFFPFNVGCSKEDCTPESSTTTSSTTTTTTDTSGSTTTTTDTSGSTTTTTDTSGSTTTTTDTSGSTTTTTDTSGSTTTTTDTSGSTTTTTDTSGSTTTTTSNSPVLASNVKTILSVLIFSVLLLI